MPLSSSIERTWERRATFPAKNTPTKHPTRTPFARSWVATVVTTVASITTEEGRGIAAQVEDGRHEKVPTET